MLSHIGGGRGSTATARSIRWICWRPPGARRRALQRLWAEDESLLSLLPRPKRHSLRGAPDVEPGSGDNVLDLLAHDFGTERRNRETVMYRIAAGDTLGRVSRQFGVDVDDLARDNGLDTDSKLREGALLKLLVDRRTLDRWGRKGANRGDDVEELGGASPAAGGVERRRARALGAERQAPYGQSQEGLEEELLLSTAAGAIDVRAGRPGRSGLPFRARCTHRHAPCSAW